MNDDTFYIFSATGIKQSNQKGTHDESFCCLYICVISFMMKLSLVIITTIQVMNCYSALLMCIQSPCEGKLVFLCSTAANSKYNLTCIIYSSSYV